jgi:hypothetical protein
MIVNPNNYPLAVGVIQKRGDEFGSDVQDVITATDKEQAPLEAKLIGKLESLGFPREVVSDVIDLTNALRGTVQEEVQRAADTTEEIREIAAEEDFSDVEDMTSLMGEQDYGYVESNETALSDEFDPYAEDNQNYGAGRYDGEYEGSGFQRDFSAPAGETKPRANAKILEAIIRSYAETERMAEYIPRSKMDIQNERALEQAEAELAQKLRAKFPMDEAVNYDLSEV